MIEDLEFAIDLARQAANHLGERVYVLDCYDQHGEVKLRPVVEESILDAVREFLLRDLGEGIVLTRLEERYVAVPAEWN